MPFSYPVEMREKAVKAYLEGKGTQEEIADIFGISVSTLRRYLILFDSDGNVAPKPHPGRSPTLDEEDLAWIKRQIEAKPDLELKQLCALLSRQSGKVVSIPTMCRALQQLDLRRKKKSFYAAEQDRDEVKKSAKITSIPLRNVRRKR
jgi:transposase